RERADMIELLFQLSGIDQPGKLDRGRAVEDAEGDAGILVAPEDRLRHQQLVEIRIEHRAHDRVDLPGVAVDASGDVGHGTPMASNPSALTPPPIAPVSRMAILRSAPYQRPATLFHLALLGYSVSAGNAGLAAAGNLPQGRAAEIEEPPPPWKSSAHGK